MQPKATLMQTLTALCGMIIAGCALAVTFHTLYENRNAQLVQVGVGVLEVDPSHGKQIQAAREWAIDLIEANAGVRFSPEARQQLMKKPLVTGGGSFSGGSIGGY
jgi:hypothetical protein